MTTKVIVCYETLISGLISFDAALEADKKKLKHEEHKDVQKTTKKEEGEQQEEDGKSELRWLQVVD